MNLDLPRPPFALVIATEALLGILFLVGLGAIALLPSGFPETRVYRPRTDRQNWNPVFP